jgi:hypothetical protein
VRISAEAPDSLVTYAIIAFHGATLKRSDFVARTLPRRNSWQNTA